jgi:hypothetical protein
VRPLSGENLFSRRVTVDIPMAGSASCRQARELILAWMRRHCSQGRRSEDCDRGLEYLWMLR